MAVLFLADVNCQHQKGNIFSEDPKLDPSKSNVTQETESTNRKRSLEQICLLPGILTECSGMVALDANTLVGQNDSGNKPILYLFSPKDPETVKTVKVLGVENHDWEELATDQDHVYIGDTGNNAGTRKNLMVYKVKKQDLLTKTEVTPEIIRYSYKDQVFPTGKKHNWDCEAFVCIGDSLYLFTKNRGDFRTNVCAVPNTPGKYVAKVLDSFDSQGLVTGADYMLKGNKGELVLIGYTGKDKGHLPFVIHFTDFDGTDFFKGKSERWVNDTNLQTETILFHTPDEVWITNEEEHGDEGYVFSLRLR